MTDTDSRVDVINRPVLFLSRKKRIPIFGKIGLILPTRSAVFHTQGIGWAKNLSILPFSISSLPGAYRHKWDEIKERIKDVPDIEPVPTVPDEIYGKLAQEIKSILNNNDMIASDRRLYYAISILVEAHIFKQITDQYNETLEYSKSNV